MATMSSQFGGVTLAIPSTDHDTDMLSDTARTDAEFEIDMDAPSVIEDQDDQMAEDFELNVATNNGPLAEVADAEMIEQEYDDQRLHEAEMYDGDLDEDDQMYNIDFDQPSESQTANDTTLLAHEIVIGDTNPKQEQDVEPVEPLGNDNNIQQLTYNETDPFNDQDIATSAEAGPQVSESSETNRKTTSTLQLSPEAVDATSAIGSNSGISNNHPDVAASLQAESGNPTVGLKEVVEEEEYLIDFDDEDNEPQHRLTEDAKSHNALPQEGSKTLENHSFNTETITLPGSTEQSTELPHEIEQDENQNEYGQGEEEEVHEDYVEEHHNREEYHNYTYNVIVDYGGDQLSLFPPSDHNLPETYLLQDHSLAEKSLTELFTACRELLGNSISEHDALEIEIPTFDLYIHEVSWC
jgi:hypothetical protein